MSTLQGTLVPLERDARGVAASAARRVYIGDHPTAGAGHYVFVDVSSEATAWLKEAPADEYTFDDSSVEDDGIVYWVSTSPNVLIL